MGVLPLRPLTQGELLDAATALLRHAGTRLILTAAALAVAEQALLYPLRRAAGLTAPLYLPTVGGFGGYWLVLAAGFGTEALIIAILGGLAARVAVPTLLDTGPPRPVPRLDLGALILVGLVAGAGAAVGAAAGLLPWIFWYLFTGLAAPALVTEQRGPGSALGRSMVLVGRSHWRPGGIRLLGYLAWYTIRLALGAGGITALGLVLPIGSSGWTTLAGVLAWTVVNTVAYAVLGCLDAVLLLECRMRVEGLDIALSRALRRGLPAERILVGR
jgi:hypothetical protein